MRKMKSRPRAFNIETFTVPILYYISSAPWVVKHLIESRAISNWKPTLIRKVSPSEIQEGRFGKWQRIRIGEEVDLPIIVKEIKEEKAGILESGGGTVLGDFKFYASETDDGFAVSWELKSGEHLYGLGERFNAFDLRGKRHVLQAADAIGSNSSVRSYKPVPFLLSSAGYGVFINTASRVLFDARGDRCLTVCSGPLDMWIVNGTPKEIITEYTDLTGRPPLIQKWALGLWVSRCMYPSRRYVEHVVDAMREEEIPCDVVSLDPLWMKHRLFCLRDCMNFEWDEKRFPNPGQMIGQFAEKGIKICLWINPYIPLLLPIFREAKSKGYLITRRGRPALTKDGPSAVVDFSNDEAVNWYKEKTAVLIKQGVKAFKTDYGEAVPEDGEHKKYSKNYIHNLYPLLYNRAVYETFEELGEPGVLWARSAWAGSQRYPVHWSGDSKCTWRDLKHVLIGGLNLSLSGFAYWSHDIGGFMGMPSRELYIRWAQCGLFVSNARLHGITPREPWVFGKKALEVFKHYAKLRYRLIPYLYTVSYIASKTGHPVLRPMVFEFPADENVHEVTEQFMLGGDLLVAPVLEKGKRKKKVYFPDGKWIDWHDLLEYEGPGFQEVSAPLERLPFFARKKSIIPLAPDVNFVDENTQPVTLLVFDPEESNSKLYDGDEIAISSSNEKNSIVFRMSPTKKSFVARFLKIKGGKIESENVKIIETSQDGDWFQLAFTTSGKEAIIKISHDPLETL
jgi:alpha-D-xyloside xylohydrolase